MKNIFFNTRTYLPVLLLCFLSCLVVGFGRMYLLPSVTELFGTKPQVEKKAAPFLFEYPKSIQQLKVKMSLQRGVFPISSLWIRADNYLTEVQEVSNNFVSATRCCGYPNGAVYQFQKPLIHPRNDVIATIRNTGGIAAIQFAPAPTDLGYVAMSVMVLFATLVLGILFRNGDDTVTLVIFATGILLRIWYLAFTPAWLRQYDVDGHLEYLATILFEKRIPGLDEGWETFQAPLYYTVAAGYLSILGAFGRSIKNAIPDLQTLSWCFELCSLTLVLCFLQQYKSQSKYLYYAALAVTVAYPGWIILSPRISNESLFHLLTICSLLSFLTWWKVETKKYWWSSWIFICLAILAKITAVIFVPLFGLALLNKVFLKKQSWSLFIAPVVSTLSIIGWYVVYRIIELGNIAVRVKHPLDVRLGITRGIEGFFIFRPLTMIRNPFNNTWGDYDLHKNFLEFLFRSAFFGEFYFGEESKFVAGAVLLFAMAMIAAIICFGRKLITTEAFPVVLIILTGIAAVGTFRYRYSYSCMQDFRYITPIAFCFVICVFYCQKPKIFTVLLSLFSISMLAFWATWFTNNA